MFVHFSPQQTGVVPPQALPQPPQLAVVPSCTQVAALPVPQTAWPLGQAPLQWPAAQVWPAPQVVPQPPQLWTSVEGLTQEPEQRMAGSAQPFWQLPAWHDCPMPQALPQDPQFSSSVWVLVQNAAVPVPQGSGVVAAQAQWPPLHCCPRAHTVPQLPQFLLSEAVLAQ
jgi:hypothetical protein